MTYDPQSPETREFIRLLTENQPRLQRFIGALMPGHPDVPDVLQETNLTLWEKIGEFESGSDFRAWAFSVAKFKVLEFYRKSKRKGLLLFDAGQLETLANSLVARSPDLREAKLKAMEECFGKLEPKHRELIHARYAPGGSLELHASRTGRPVQSLYTTLYRLRAALRHCIENRLQITGQMP